MGSIFLEGLLLGYGAAVPLGPINIFIANYALFSYKKALMMGFGAMSADISYLLLILFGSVELLENQMIFRVIGLFGGVFLLYLSWKIYQNRYQSLTKQPLAHESLKQIFFKGWTLTLLNPYTVGFWVSVSALVKAGENPFWLFVGLVISILSWTSLMPLLIYRRKHLLSPKLTMLFAQVSALILGTFALILLFGAAHTFESKTLEKSSIKVLP